jgi:hypothetical protein
MCGCLLVYGNNGVRVTADVGHPSVGLLLTLTKGYSKTAKTEEGLNGTFQDPVSWSTGYRQGFSNEAHITAFYDDAYRWTTASYELGVGYVLG